MQVMMFWTRGRVCLGLVTGLALLGAAWFLVGQLPSVDPRAHAPLVGVLLVAAAAGMALVAGGVATLHARAPFRTSSLTLNVARAAPGAVVVATVRLDPRRPVRIRESSVEYVTQRIVGHGRRLRLVRVTQPLATLSLNGVVDMPIERVVTSTVPAAAFWGLTGWVHLAVRTGRFTTLHLGCRLAVEPGPPVT